MSAPHLRAFAIGAVLIAAGLTCAPAWAQLAESANRECATCHIMWLTEFKRQDVTTLIPFEPKPVTESGREDVASTERMCFSCHDGFALDSRFMWRSRQHAHPVGVKPSNKVQIPTSAGKVIFPMNEDGRVYCGTCHTAHGVEWKKQESPVFLRVKNVDSSMCFACHLDQSTGPAEGNHPVFAKIKQLPPELAAVGGKTSRAGEVICQSCHRAHGAPAKNMLLVDNRAGKLCAKCHSDKKDIVNSKHDLAAMAPEARNRNNQTAAESGTCGACHVPHNGKGPALWAREPMPGRDAATAACLGCHNAEGLAKEKLTGEHSHPINVPVADSGISVTPKGWESRHAKDRKLTALPLYDARGLYTTKDGRVGCGSCHDPHRWAPEAASTAPETKGRDARKAAPTTTPDDPRKVDGTAASSFLRLAADGDSPLCGNCHVDKVAIALSKHNPAVMASGEFKSGGATATTAAARAPTQNLCGACHQPHNAKGGYLWARNKGPGKGAVEQLCTDCHRDNGEASKKLAGADSHAVGVALKDKPSDLRLPLYGSNGQKDANGRIDCGTCHDPHAWDARNLASRAGADVKVEGDARTSFLRLASAPDSELCVECHRKQRVVRKTDHDLAVSAPQGVNAMGQTVTQSGVCGQCHVPHNAQIGKALWARKAGDGSDAQERLCRSCHAPGQVAEAKQPREARHPEKVLTWASAVRDRFRPRGSLPVYDSLGVSEHAGVITCSTCHDPHQWSPKVAAEGPGKKVEGDVGNSFLRLTSSAKFLCADCHGADALFRYKYFHGKSSRREYPLYR